MNHDIIVKFRESWVTPEFIDSNKDCPECIFDKLCTQLMNQKAPAPCKFLDQKGKIYYIWTKI